MFFISHQAAYGLGCDSFRLRHNILNILYYFDLTLVFSALNRSHCVLGPRRALSPRVGPLLKYFSVFLAFCQQPCSFPGVPLAARPDTGCPLSSILPSVCAPDRPKHTIILAWFTATAVAAARHRRRVSDSLLFV